MGEKERSEIRYKKANISIQHDVLVSIINEIFNLKLHLVYVPQDFIFERSSIKKWLAKYEKKWLNNPEELCANLLEDINNEIIPKFARIMLRLSPSEILIVEGRRPGWSNPQLLRSLELYTKI